VTATVTCLAHRKPLNGCPDCADDRHAHGALQRVLANLYSPQDADLLGLEHWQASRMAYQHEAERQVQAAYVQASMLYRLAELHDQRQEATA
jgi:hypothetical protein